MPPVKVLVTGAYSTGKSTLSGALQKELLNDCPGNSVALVKGVARESGLNLNLDQTAETTAWLLGAQIERERTVVSNYAHQYVVCDRGVPDILAHNLDAAQRGNGLHDETVIQSSIAWCDTYDIVLLSLIDSAQAVEEDGLRIQDPVYRQRMQGFALQAVKHCKKPIILPGGFEDRVRLSKHAILALGNCGRSY